MQKAVIGYKDGFNAQVVATIVYKAYELEEKYGIKIFFGYKEYEKIAATDFLSLMNLPIKKGDEIGVVSEGEDSNSAVEQMISILENNDLGSTTSDHNRNNLWDLQEIKASKDSKELKESQNLILESLPNGICNLDTNGYITYANAAFLEFMSPSSGQIIGQHINNFSPTGSNGEELFFGRKVMNFVIEMTNGISAVADINPIFVGGKFTSAILVIQDSKEIRNLKDQLQIAIAKVEYLEEKLTQNKEAGWFSARMKSEPLEQKGNPNKEVGWYAASNMKSESPEQKMLRTMKSGKAFEKFIGMSQKVLDALALAAKAAKVQSTVLIRGSSGTGKELVAEGIHQASSRAQGPFIRVNCAAIPVNLLESEFFGHEKGSFTGAVKRKLGKFELADKGTIFLDEIGEMEVSMQTKLLRVLQSSQFERVGGEETIEVDVRVLAATNRNMEQMVKDGGFREDLYYRLNVIPIYLPPLKERKEDIPLLVDYFLKKFRQEFGKQIIGIKKSAMDALIRHDWPGNVRELQNILERMIALTDSLYIEMSDIPTSCINQSDNNETQMRDIFMGTSLKSELFPLAEYEKQIIRVALEKYGSYTAAGKVLGITHKTVAAKAQKYGISRADE